MPNWNQVLREIETESQKRSRESPHDVVRRRYLKRLQRHTKRNIIAYYSGFLSKPDIGVASINDDDKNALMMAVHELDRSNGLDLLLHTPGGQIAATESLVDYLQQMFGNNMRAIVPHIAMSAGTMIACCCREIVMGKHSNLGPIDPQIQGIPAAGVKREFETAYKEIKADPVRAAVWAPIIQRYPPTFLQQCEYAIQWSEEFVKAGLLRNMFEDDADASEKADRVVSELSDIQKNKAHNRHIPLEQCAGIGLKVRALESDQVLQDLVLTVHHCFMHTLSNTAAIKIVENHLGRAIVRNQVSPSSLSVGLPGRMG